MKKTALTIGLFSLVVVATSFANPSESTNSIDPKGGYTGGGAGSKKQDVYAPSQDINLGTTKLDFSNTSQSLGLNKKID